MSFFSTAELKYPAGDGSLIAGADVIFKEFYLPAVRDQLNHQTILKRMVTRNRTSISGNSAICALRTGRNEASISLPEGGRLPEPGSQEYQRAIYRMRYQYNTISISGQAIASSRNDRGAFTQLLDAEIRGATQDRLHEDNRILFSNGSGAYARVAAAVSSGSTVTVKDPGGFANDGPGTLYLRPGKRVAFVTGSTATINDSGVVDSVDRAAGTVTITGTFTGTLADDLIVAASETPPSSINDTSFANEPYGLAALIDNDNVANYPSARSANAQVGGIDATSVALWNSTAINSAGTLTPFTSDFIQQGEDAVAQVAGTQVDFLITDYTQRREYLNQLQTAKRYPNTREMDAGWTALDYNGRPLLVDKDCTPGRLYGISQDALMIFEEKDYKWLDEDGSILQRIPSRDAYQATLVGYWSTGIDARNRHFVVKNLDV